MTRTNKWTVHEKASEPKYFTHHGHADMNPNKVSKNGNGKYNWGKPGDELMDDAEFADAPMMKMTRRNSNHSANELEIGQRTQSCEKLVNL